MASKISLANRLKKGLRRVTRGDRSGPVGDSNGIQSLSTTKHESFPLPASQNGGHHSSSPPYAVEGCGRALDDPLTGRELSKERHGLFTFYSPENGAAEVDIIALHGLMGDYQESWTDNGKLWLRDREFLPREIPSARIMSYGYDAAIAFTRTANDTRDVALAFLVDLQRSRQPYGDGRRPIVFLCHSFGGIIVKEALVTANEDRNRFGDLLESVKGLVFFGVPHRGSAIASYTSGIASALHKSTFGILGNTKFIKKLHENSSFLSELSERSTQLLGNIAYINSFFEMKRLGGMLTVSRESARIGIVNERLSPLAKDHRGICRFDSPSKWSYQTVKGCLVEMVRDIRKIQSDYDTKRQRLLNKICVLPQDIMKRPTDSVITSKFRTSKISFSWILCHERYTAWLHETYSSVLWVTGRPGCGKPTLASFVIDSCPKGSQVLYFFFDNKFPAQGNALAFARSLLYQILADRRDFLEFVQNLESRYLESPESVWGILKQCFDSIACEPQGSIIFVVDALDECLHSEREQILTWLNELLAGGLRSVRVLITSVYNVRIQESLESGFAWRHIDYDEPGVYFEVKNEVRAYIFERVESMPALKSWSSNWKQELQHNLCLRADNTYLWVSLFLDTLPDTADISDMSMKKLLDLMPDGLDSIYQKMIETLCSHSIRNTALTKACLEVLIEAFEPLPLEDLGVCIAADKDATSMADVIAKRQHNMERSVHLCCGPLIRVIDGYCFFVHSTARDFLESPELQISWKKGPGSLESAHIMALSCVQFLNLSDFNAYRHTDFSIGSIRFMGKELANNNAFLKYCSLYWAKHVSRWRDLTPNSNGDNWLAHPVNLGVAKLYEKNLVLRSLWYSKIVRMTESQGSDSIHIQEVSESHFAAYNGHLQYLTFVSSGALPILGYTVLHTAILGNHFSTVASLLINDVSLQERGVPFVERPDIWGRTPLHLASSRGSLEIVELLLVYGAHPCAYDLQMRTPLYYSQVCGLPKIERAIMSWFCAYTASLELLGIPVPQQSNDNSHLDYTQSSYWHMGPAFRLSYYMGYIRSPYSFVELEAYSETPTDAVTQWMDVYHSNWRSKMSQPVDRYIKSSPGQLDGNRISRRRYPLSIESHKQRLDNSSDRSSRFSFSSSSSSSGPRRSSSVGSFSSGMPQRSSSHGSFSSRNPRRNSGQGSNLGEKLRRSSSRLSMSSANQ